MPEIKVPTVRFYGVDLLDPFVTPAKVISALGAAGLKKEEALDKVKEFNEENVIVPRVMAPVEILLRGWKMRLNHAWEEYWLTGAAAPAAAVELFATNVVAGNLLKTNWPFNVNQLNQNTVFFVQKPGFGFQRNAVPANQDMMALYGDWWMTSSEVLWPYRGASAMTSYPAGAGVNNAATFGEPRPDMMQAIEDGQMVFRWGNNTTKQVFADFTGATGLAGTEVYYTRFVGVLGYLKGKG